MIVLVVGVAVVTAVVIVVVVEVVVVVVVVVVKRVAKLTPGRIHRKLSNFLYHFFHV